MPNDGQLPVTPQVQPQPVSPQPAGQPAPQRQAFSALESDPEVIQDVEEPDDPDMDMAVEFMSQPNNPDLFQEVPREGNVEGEPSPDGQTPQFVPTVTQGAPSAAPEVNPAVAPVVAPAVQPQQTAQPQPQPGAPAPAPVANPSDAFQAINTQIEARKTELVGMLAGQTYQLSQGELEGIQTEPEKVLPQLMAKVHLNAVQAVLRHVAQQIPAAVTSIVSAHQQNKSLEDQFYSAWPQLDRTKHDNTVRQMAFMYRQVNPAAPMDEMIRAVGAQVSTVLGLPIAAPTAQNPAPVRQVRQVPQPYVPAGPAQASVPAHAQRHQPNEWERLASYISLDDQGRFEAS